MQILNNRHPFMDVLAVWFSYSFSNLKEARLPLQEFSQILEEEGFGKYAPRLRTAAERFRSAVAPIEGTYQGSQGYLWKVANATVTEASEDFLEVVVLAAEISREDKDTTPANKVARIVFDKKTASLQIVTKDNNMWYNTETFHECPEFLKPALDGLEESVRKQFGIASESQIRGVFDRVVHECAIPTRTRANWTFPENKRSLPEALSRVAERMNEYLGKDHVSTDLKELVDTAKNREGLPEDAVAYAKASFGSIFRELVKEAEEADSSVNPEVEFQKVLDKFQTQTDSLLEMFETHERTIGSKLEEIETLKEEAKKKLMSFGLQVA